jgi:hypothetical protein
VVVRAVVVVKRLVGRCTLGMTAIQSLAG